VECGGERAKAAALAAATCTADAPTGRAFAVEKIGTIAAYINFLQSVCVI
jgi:hypothetical protein